MNLKETVRKHRRGGRGVSDDLNITPIMNIFLILVPFLLLTAVFVRIAVLEFSLPSTDPQAREATTEPKDVVVTILAINEDGFELKTEGMTIPFIEAREDTFDFQTLVARLREVKERHADTENIIIAPQASIKYDIIIKVMDRCRENGFSNISISG